MIDPIRHPLFDERRRPLVQTSKLLASRATNYRLKSITSPSNHKGPFGWRDFRKDGKNGRKSYFCGCLVRKRRGWNIGGARLLSPQAHQKPISPIWRENGREKKALLQRTILPPFHIEFHFQPTFLFFFFFFFFFFCPALLLSYYS